MCSLQTGIKLCSALLHRPLYTEEEEEDFINPTMGKFATMAVFTWSAIAARTVTLWGFKTLFYYYRPMCAPNSHPTRTRGLGQ